MAEIHTKMVRKKIAEKKAKRIEEDLEQLIDQLKGQMESPATAEVKSPKLRINISSKINKFHIKIPFEFSILYSFKNDHKIKWK